MTNSYLLNPKSLFSLLPEILILASALIILVLDLFSKHFRGRIFIYASLLVLISFFICLFYFPHLLTSSSELVETPNLGVSTNFATGKSLLFFRLLIMLGVFYIFAFSKQYLKDFAYQAEYLVLLLFASLGLMITISAQDLILLFLGIELSTITFYLLAAFFKQEKKSLEAGLKFFFLGTLSTVFLLFGFSLLFGLTGVTNFLELKTALSGHFEPAIINLLLLFIVISFAFKIALFPFQMWVADVYEGAPTLVTAWLAGASKLAGFIAFSRLITTVFSSYAEFLWPLLIILASFSLLYGNIVAVAQNNIKRLLAFSSIGHAGFILIGVLTEQLSQLGIFIYLLAYSLSTLMAFISVTLVQNKLQTEQINDYRGLSKKTPFLSLFLTLTLLSLLGLPPLPVFWGKFLILKEIVSGGLIWLAVLALFTTLISAYYHLKIIKKIYLDVPIESAEKNTTIPKISFSPLETILLVTLLGFFSFFSLFPNALFSYFA